MRTIGPASLLIIASVVGCGGRGEMRTSGSTPAAPTADRLLQRTKTLWDARVADDCKRIFLFEDPVRQAASNVDKFCAWHNAEEPFVIKSYTADTPLIEGDMGWVQIRYSSTMRRIPNLPPRDATTWQRWHWRETDWFPVPRDQLDSYPESPRVRDAEQEQRLAARFDKLKELRFARNWTAAYEFVDPRDREGMKIDDYAREADRLNFTRLDRRWVEVRGQYGRVMALFGIKLNDPSLGDLPPREAYSVEMWTLIDGEWYLDLKRQPGGPVQIR
ncbi:MAG: hypothetical protein CHACPFDD_02391 [Phycisphaerae bacterium]|nr:hypothetical protein [Phycisphaerae bacterium]